MNLAVHLRNAGQFGWVVLAAVAAVLVAFSETTNGAPPQGEDFEEVSLVQLIANPERFDGKRIIVVGVNKSDFESHALYLTKDDAALGIRPNSVALSFLEDGVTITKEEWNRLNGSYVRVVGTFRSGPSGHMSLWRGELFRISSISALKK